MIAALLLATLTTAPGRPPASGVEPAHATAEAALLRAAYPDHDQKSGWLGHNEGVLIGQSSACVEKGPCLLAVVASDVRDGREASTAHAWSTFFAFRAAEAGWVETGHAAGPVINAVGTWRFGVAVLIDGDGPFITATTATSGGAAGDSAATHVWNWNGKKFLPVFTAATTRKGTAETEASFLLCADRPEDRPSWELRTRERAGRGAWTESRVRVAWSEQAWVERPADRPCVERTGSAAVMVAAPAASASPPAAVKVKSASASRTATASKGQPRATAAANAIDGDRQTAWVPGGKKGGVGEWLQIDLAAPALLGSVQLLGTCPGADWKAGPRLKKVRLRFEDGPVLEAALSDVPGPQSIVVTRKAPARLVRIELLELYAGTKRQDACLSEASPQGR